MNNWKEVTLGEVCDFQKGFAFKSNEYQTEGIKIVKVSNFGNDNINLHDCVCINHNEYDLYKKYSLKSDDILITTVGSWPTNPNSVVGKVIKTQEEANNSLLNQNAVRIRHKCLEQQKYIYYLLKNNIFSKYIIGTAQGSANQASIMQVDIKKFTFNLPPLPEQKAIAHTLSCLDDKIELNNKINKNLEEMAQAIFKSWFVNFDPFKDSEFVDSELGKIPKGWRVGTIGEVADINKNTYSTSDNWKYINYLDTSNITKGVILEIQKLDCNIDKIPSRAKRKICANDIIYSTVRPNQNHYGVLNNVEDNMLVSTGFAVISSREHSLSTEHIYLCLIQLNVIEKLQQIAETTASTFPAIKPSDIADIKIVIPPQNIENDFKYTTQHILFKMSQNRTQNQQLAKIRDTLLPKLMSGKVRVPLEETI